MEQQYGTTTEVQIYDLTVLSILQEGEDHIILEEELAQSGSSCSGSMLGGVHEGIILQEVHYRGSDQSLHDLQEMGCEGHQSVGDWEGPIAPLPDRSDVSLLHGWIHPAFLHRGCKYLEKGPGYKGASIFYTEGRDSIGSSSSTIRQGVYGRLDLFLTEDYIGEGWFGV